MRRKECLRCESSRIVVEKHDAHKGRVLRYGMVDNVLVDGDFDVNVVVAVSERPSLA